MAETPFQSRRGLIQMKPASNQKDLSIAPKELSRFVKFNQSVSHLNIGGVDNVSVSERSMLDLSSDILVHQQNIYKQKTDLLFPQFLEVLQARTNDSEVFETIQDLIQTCSGVLEVVQKELKHIGGSGARQRFALSWLKQEIKTWKLLGALYNDRILCQVAGTGMDCDEVAPLGSSEKEIICQLYRYNSTIREYQLVVDWLEACYERSESEAQVGHSSDRSVGWENTLFQLHSEKEIAFGKGVEIVKSMDPDAPIREKRPLHALDEEDNLRLSRCIFAEIRQGRIDEAQSLCKYSGQTWRAAILEGWRLHEDSNYENPLNTKEKEPIEGNPRRDLWKKCAWMMADSKKFDEFTRAIAGAFCGHLESLKSLLGNSWEDLLWAYLKVQIDIRVESEIRACSMKSYTSLPEPYWNGKMSMEQVFDELEVHNDAAVRDFSNSKVGIIQKYLILDNISELLEQMKRWIDESDAGTEEPKLSAHLLRLLTHIILFLRQIGRVEREEIADRVIAAYVECLILQGDPQLVAFYTAAVPTKMQIELYSKFIQRIQESAARASALEAAISAGLDVESITRHAVETIRLRMPTKEEEEERKGLQTGDIAVFDKEKIRALEWLTFLPAQRGDLLWQANAMIRTFLAQSNAECVRAAYNMVPIDSLSHIINIYGSKDNLPCREECAIKEYLSYKIYITAIDAFNAWSRMFYGRPQEPKLVNSGANFTERVASEHKESLYRTELNRWQMNLDEQTKLTRDALYNVLLFPEKGWLIDPDTPKDPVAISETDWENRQIQLDKLRNIGIPEIVLLLHKLLHLSGDYQGCMKLADDIASETRQLYKVYTKHKLAELLAQLADTSLQLLNNKSDPWGFPVTA